MALTEIWSSSGSSLPIVRWVYLVQDASDAARMGGASNNVYTSLTTAYSVADALQTALGGTNYVGIKVIGRTTQTLTLTANWNLRVALFGDGPDLSQITSITLSNGAGNGYNFGTGASLVSVIGLRITSGINTNATGGTGDSGQIRILSNGSYLGSLQAICSNAANTTGSSGGITVTDLNGTTQISTISNNILAVASTGASGEISLNASGRMLVGAIENTGADYQGVTGGNVTLKNVDCTSLKKFTSIGVSIKNCNISSVLEINLLADATVNIYNTTVGDSFSINGFGTTSNLFIRNFKCALDFTLGLGSVSPNFITLFKNVLIWDSYFDNTYSTNSPGTDPALSISDVENLIIEHSEINNIDDVDAQTGAATAVMFIASAGLLSAKLINCSSRGGAAGLDSDAAINVDTANTYIEQANGVNITIVPL